MRKNSVTDASPTVSFPRPADRLLNIDCLRGVAALEVFVFHVSGTAGFEKRTLPVFLFRYGTVTVPNFLSLGASGVNLFFVISGFCLALQQWRAKRETLGVDCAPYFRNRFARIVPAYWAAILFSALLSVAQGAGPVSIAESAAVHALFLHGLHPMFFLSLNGALWSMATEVEFYLVFPLLFLLQTRCRSSLFLALIGLSNLLFRFGVAHAQLPNGQWSITWSALLAYQLPGRLLEFGLGMWLAKLYMSKYLDKRKLFLIMLLPAGGLALWCRGWGPSWCPDIALAIFYSGLVGAIVLGRHLHLPAKLESLGAGFGRGSYSFFLIHLPILLLIARMVPLEPGWTKFLVLGGVSFACCFICAWVFYKTIELPLWNRLRISTR